MVGEVPIALGGLISQGPGRTLRMMMASISELALGQ